MTRAEEVYADTLNLLGSDPLIAPIQEAVDREHALTARNGLTMVIVP
jgi:hypothetical protein